jgi:hypothetical protein
MAQQSDGLHPVLMGLSWMIGRWQGTGKASYPGTEDFEFGQQIDFSHNGENYLHYLSQIFERDDDGHAVRPLSMETGFWRPQQDGSLEVVMCHPSGYAEVWYGRISGHRCGGPHGLGRGLLGGPEALRQRRGGSALDLRQGGIRPAAPVAHVGPAPTGVSDISL